MFGIFAFRLMIFKLFYDVLFMSLLSGWSQQKPTIMFGPSMNPASWERMKNEVTEWINFYHTIEVSL